jgi:hypothetical protein
MVSFKSNNYWVRIFALVTLLLGQGAHAADLGLVSDHGQLSVSGANIVNQNGDIVQLRGMSSHALSARYPFDTSTNPPTPALGEAAGTYTTKETIQWTRDHWGANAFRAAMYVEGWGVADPRNWQYQNSSYERDASGTAVLVESSGGIFYAEPQGYKQEPPRLHAAYMHNLFDVIQWAIDLDMYVLVDWHVLEDTPDKYQEEAKMFFELVMAKFPNTPNIIFEIANEPTDVAREVSTAEFDAAVEHEQVTGNKFYTEKVYAVTEALLASKGWYVADIKYLEPDWEERSDEWFTWPQLKTYAEDILPVIRAQYPTAVVTVGTPIYSQQIDDPTGETGGTPNRLDDPNVVYTMHFYACTHLSKADDTDAGDTDTFGNTDVFQNTQIALDNGLPVFVSEWGTVKSYGGGNVCEGQTKAWIEFLNQNNISWFNWSMSGKDEGASVFTADLDPNFSANLDTVNVIDPITNLEVTHPETTWDATWTTGVTTQEVTTLITVAGDDSLSTNLSTSGKLVKCLMSENCVEPVAACNFDTTMEPHQYSAHWQGEISIENTSANPTSEWEVVVQMASGQSIYNAWGQSLVDLGNGRYRISSQAWNAVIPAGQSLVFGLHGAVSANDEPLDEVILSGDTCGEPVSKLLLLDESVDGNTFYHTLPIANFFNGTTTADQDIIATIDGTNYNLTGIFCCRGNFFLHQNGITLGEHTVSISTGSGLPEEKDEGTFTFSNAIPECTIEVDNEWGTGADQQWNATVTVDNVGYKLGTRSGPYWEQADSSDTVLPGKDWSVRLEWIENYPSTANQIQRNISSLDGKANVYEKSWINGFGDTTYYYDVVAASAPRSIDGHDSLTFQISGTGAFSTNNSQYNDLPYIGCSFGQSENYQQ